MLVAAALGLIALGMLSSNVIPAIMTLGRTGEVYQEARVLDLAADTVVRLVAVAREGTGVSPVIVDSGELVIAGDDAQDVMPTRVIISAGRLIVSDGGSPSGAVAPDQRVLIDDLEPTSRIELLDVTGSPTTDSHAGVAVRIVLHRAGRMTDRLVHTRSG